MISFASPVNRFSSPYTVRNTQTPSLTFGMATSEKARKKRGEDPKLVQAWIKRLCENLANHRLEVELWRNLDLIQDEGTIRRHMGEEAGLLSVRLLRVSPFVEMGKIFGERFSGVPEAVLGDAKVRMLILDCFLSPKSKPSVDSYRPFPLTPKNLTEVLNGISQVPGDPVPDALIDLLTDFAYGRITKRSLNLPARA